MGELTPDRAQLRISDDDRHRVAELLREAAGEGRIDLDELGERLEATYAAKTYGDLVPITVDLPASGPTPLTPATHPARQVDPTATTHPSSLAIMSECKRRGAWLVPPAHTATAVMGSVLLDLREASFSGPETTIHANAIMGEVKILVGAHTRVVVNGTPLMGEYTHSDRIPAQLDATSPLVHVRGLALMGSVKVERRAQPGEGRRMLRRH